MFRLVSRHWHDCVHDHFDVLLRESESLLNDPDMRAVEATARLL